MQKKVVTSKAITKGTPLVTTPHVEVVLHSCRNLKAMDLNGFSDPYVVFTVGAETVKSSTKKKTLNPDYEENFLVCVKPGQVELQLRVMDWDLLSTDDLCGEAEVYLVKLPKDVPVKMELELTKKGTIQLTLTARGFGVTKAQYEADQKESGSMTATKRWAPVQGVGKGDVKQAKLGDSNVAKIGSLQDIEQRVAAARTADEWKGVGLEPGLRIWRIEKFKVKPWPVIEYGRFYSGDSFIILNTYKHPTSKKLMYDVHFWLGESSTLDEIGVAAYKTVELDDLLDRVPVQHREVQGHESELFLGYFKDPIVILEGGIDSGFNHVKPTEYVPHLLHVKGRKRVRVTETDLTGSSLNNGDVFILDAGLKLYLWKGSQSNPQEQYKGATTVSNLKSERGGKPEEIRLEEAGSEEFWKILGGKPKQIKAATAEPSDDDADACSVEKYQLFKLSDASGKLKFTFVSKGKITKSMLGSKDAYVLDVGNRIFVYIGKGASKAEKTNAVFYAQKYLLDNSRPSYVPITRVLQGSESPFFEQFLN